MTGRAEPVVMLVDVANVLGARPDGWWRDRLGATERLLAVLAGLGGHDITSPDGARWCVERMAVVLEGQARDAAAPAPLEAYRAAGSGDDELVRVATELSSQELRVVAVTGDRGLRSRLASSVEQAGPGWLRAVLDARSPVRTRHADDTPQ